ncbi:hypothetical protein L3Q82_017278 [Scortum barcoo]|uniref:Uncharacterized protein n=1 Tax=Scortum barcoo TaxID=214431 RepID=A0ACB8VKJ5_9TELE|nr:hypothetical protein L3Q82_017278 [Scortum barcoo]
MCFVDLEKAFDRVPRGILWGVLREYGVRGPLLRAVRSLYDRSRSLVRIAGSKSDLFPVHVGLRQGCPLSPVLFIIFMDRISRRSQGPEGVRFGNHRISSLLFADDVVLLASSSQDLQHVLERFAAECEAAGMRISTSKSEAMVLDRKRVVCPLRVSGEVLPQVEEFKYLGVLFTSEGKMEREIDRRIGAASAVMRSVYRTVVVKKELSRKASKLSIYRSIYVPTLTYGHELWVMTERTRSRIQAAEMSFLRRVAGRSLRDRVRSSVIREELGVEPLLLRIERSQLRWLGHLFRMPPGRLPREVFQACPTGRRPSGKTQDTLERLCLSSWPGNASGIPPEELEEVSGLLALSPSVRTSSAVLMSSVVKREMVGNPTASVAPFLYSTDQQTLLARKQDEINLADSILMPVFSGDPDPESALLPVSYESAKKEKLEVTRTGKSAREAVQESLGFSPAELVFGHAVRGPVKALKEKFLAPEVASQRNVLDYVSQFRERLHQARSFAKDALASSQSGMKRRFDRSAVVRHFTPGDKVLALLPVPGSSLSARFSGPYELLLHHVTVRYTRPHNCGRCTNPIRLSNLTLHLSLTREQDPEILELLHLRQDLSTHPERARHPFPVENHGLRFGGADSHPSRFTPRLQTAPVHAEGPGLMMKPIRTTSSAKSRDEMWFPNRTPSGPWLRLEILSIKNRTGDKGQALPESNMHWEQV